MSPGVRHVGLVEANAANMGAPTQRRSHTTRRSAATTSGTAHGSRLPDTEPNAWVVSRDTAFAKLTVMAPTTRPVMSGAARTRRTEVPQQ